MEKLHWSDENVIEFLEYKIEHNEVTEDEMEFYEDMIWNGKLNKKKFFHTYKELIKQLRWYHVGR